MATGTITKIGAIKLTNGSIDLSKTPVLIVNVTDQAVSNGKFDFVITGGGTSQKVLYIDRNNSQMYLISGYAAVSSGTLTLSNFKRSPTNSATMTDVTAPTINSIFGILG